MQNIPHSDENEKALLGSLILAPNKIDEIKDDINEDYFYNDKNKAIFRAVFKLYKQKKGIDYITIISELDKARVIYDKKYVIELGDCVPSAANYRFYFEQCREECEKRSLLRIAYKAVKGISEGLGAAEVRNELRSSKMEEISLKDYSYNDHVSEMAEKTALKFRDISKKIYATGFEFIDNPIYSLMPAETLFIAAEGGLGKSTLCKEIAINMAQNGVACVFETLEQTKESMYTSIINGEAAKSRVDHNFLALTEMLKDYKESAAEFYKAQTKENIFLFDKPSTYLSDIRKHIRLVKKTTKKPVCLFLDSFSQLNIAGTYKSDTERENEISKEITQLAKEENIPIIIIHHNNKEGKFRGSEKLKDNSWWWISLSPIGGETNSKYINPKWVKTREFRGAFKDVIFEKVNGYIKEITDEYTIQSALEDGKKQKKMFT
ncbi:MAG: DnaB-like helicase N-terminal domain-containing protein [Lewinella sp.]|uniref:DnaB-like helicase N-terminal domain-containing protein n=1 Tax=Lewinella sp. TaxID=2004506 RepID=UPI003D6AAAA5